MWQLDKTSWGFLVPCECVNVAATNCTERRVKKQNRAWLMSLEYFVTSCCIDLAISQTPTCCWALAQILFCLSFSSQTQKKKATMCFWGVKDLSSPRGEAALLALSTQCLLFSLPSLHPSPCPLLIRLVCGGLRHNMGRIASHWLINVCPRIPRQQ